MSVWVEISSTVSSVSSVSSRSTWACELKCTGCFTFTLWIRHAPRERVSWNELTNSEAYDVISHAPRERVSWNVSPTKGLLIIAKSRSTWACELKYPMRKVQRISSTSRSTWACELKCHNTDPSALTERHAPRERVSWNISFWTNEDSSSVTLHVSVWVEISHRWFFACAFSSRSTWACELKFMSIRKGKKPYSHAPRERVSWN